MPRRNRELEFDILHLIYQSPVPLTTVEVIEALSDKHLRKYSSYQSYRNFVIKKLNWFTLLLLERQMTLSVSFKANSSWDATL